jgi:hypothetical protein
MVGINAGSFVEADRERRNETEPRVEWRGEKRV